LIRLGFVFKSVDIVWIRRFSELAEVVRGGKSVADLFQANHGLWCWVGYQRTIWNKLRAGQIRLPEEMGVEKNPCEAAWMRQYEKLVEFHRAHGHFRIPKRGHQALAIWTTSQRRHRRNLSSEQQRLLDAIGFPWDPQADELEERFRQVEAFKQKYGHCFVSTRGVNDEFPGLGRWMEGLRAQRSKLLPGMAERLNAAGFVWDIEAARWEQRFQELAAFHRQFGHCRVPSKWPQNPSIRAWAAHQRRKYHRLSAEQQRRLTELGFSAESRKGRPPSMGGGGDFLDVNPASPDVSGIRSNGVAGCADVGGNCAVAEGG